MKKRNILAHRGMWLKASEKNSRRALSKALEMDFGLETDVRDLNGELVISHDPPKASEYITLEWLLDFYQSNKCQGYLALNIKSGGLAQEVGTLLDRYKIENKFVFDMSIPDTLCYLREKIPFFSRMSEYEPKPAMVEFCGGIWLDDLTGRFPQIELMSTTLRTLGKPIALVSQELHGREHRNQWHAFKESGLCNDSLSLICTDLPEDADDYFRSSTSD